MMSAIADLRILSNKKRSREVFESPVVLIPGLYRLYQGAISYKEEIYSLPGGSTDTFTPTGEAILQLFCQGIPSIYAIIPILLKTGTFVPMEGGSMTGPEWWERIVIPWKYEENPPGGFMIPSIPPESDEYIIETYIVIHWKITQFLRDTHGNRPSDNTRYEAYRLFFWNILGQIERVIYSRLVYLPDPRRFE